MKGRTQIEDELTVIWVLELENDVVDDFLMTAMEIVGFSMVERVIDAFSRVVKANDVSSMAVMVIAVFLVEEMEIGVSSVMAKVIDVFSVVVMVIDVSLPVAMVNDVFSTEEKAFDDF